MSEFIHKIADNIDISTLQKKLLEHPEYFGLYKNRLREEGPHRESTDIWVRYGDYEKYGSDIFCNEHDSVWYPIAKKIPEAADIAFKIMNIVKGERLGGVLITRLEPNKKVYPHIDTYGWHPNYYDKYYVPISNKNGAIFAFEDKEVQGIEGEAYWFRNDVPHWVNNDSDEVRIAMVVCIKPFKEFT